VTPHRALRVFLVLLFALPALLQAAEK